MPIILSVPVAPEHVPAPDWSPLPMSWTGWDGSVWPLVGAAARNPRLGRGVKGLHMPKFTVQKSSSLLIPGAEVEGYSINEREVYWPVLFRAETQREWLAEHGAFFDSFHPVKTGTWTVGSGVDARTLPLRGDFTGNHVFDRDPALSLWTMVGLELEAPRPLWRGRAIKQRFENSEGVPFIDPAGSPPLHISRGASFAEAAVNNPGDEPAYMVHTMEGPLDQVVIGFGDALIDVPFPVPAGSVLVIDTDPSSRLATLDGVDVTRELGFQMFAPVPAKGATPLTLIADGGGAVTVEITPLYWRAF